MAFQPLPGFRDFYPETMALRRHVEAAWHAAARGAGFEEVDGPPLESLDLFKAKSGEAIAEELYAFTDKGGREVALRAELTPTVARMVGAQAQALKKPVKWYAVPQLFRYQRQQRGRLREHIQWNVDVVGAPEVAADAEAVAVAIDALRRLGLDATHVYVRCSHKALVETKLRELGCPDDGLETILRLIDKEVLDAERAADYLAADAVAALQEWLAAPAESEELAAFQAACDDYGVGDFVAIDKNIVRGLAYYTGVVWEIFDRGRTLRAVAGGGRYDTLVERLGGPDLPALGFGMGDVVLGELLAERGLVPEPPARLDALVVPTDDAMLGPARRVCRALRDAGAAAETPYRRVKFNKALKAANLAGAAAVYIVRPDAWDAGDVIRLVDGAETAVPFSSL